MKESSQALSLFDDAAERERLKRNAELGRQWVERWRKKTEGERARKDRKARQMKIYESVMAKVMTREAEG